MSRSQSPQREQLRSPTNGLKTSQFLRTTQIFKDRKRQRFPFPRPLNQMKESITEESIISPICRSNPRPQHSSLHTHQSLQLNPFLKPLIQALTYRSQSPQQVRNRSRSNGSKEQPNSRTMPIFQGQTPPPFPSLQSQKQIRQIINARSPISPDTLPAIQLLYPSMIRRPSRMNRFLRP